MYKIYTDEKNRVNRIEYTAEAGPDTVPDFPGRPIDDYLFIDGKLIHSPIEHPAFDPNAPAPDSMEQKLAQMQAQIDALLEGRTG